MPNHQFCPGFRLSKLDVFVLIAGTVAAGVATLFVWWVGYVIALVIGHFFLFCNVFRLARPLELAWAAVFVVLAGATVAVGWPGWLVTTLATLATTAIVVALEMRKPSYHGVLWQRINPGLKTWWEVTTLRDELQRT
jgi:hypothetical protein